MKGDLLETFQSFRTIYCICPCCNNLMRLSDINLHYAGEAPETWLDKYEKKVLVLQKKEEKFQEKEKEMREKAKQKGRAQVPDLVRQCFDKNLAKLPYDPYDIKPIWHPIDFVIFNGLNKINEKKSDVIEDIVFLSKKVKDKELNELRKTIKDTVEDEKYDWKVARVTDKGIITLEDK